MQQYVWERYFFETDMVAIDLEPFAAGCAAHLAGDSAAVDTATRRFVACALGLGEQRGNTRVEAHDTHCGSVLKEN